MADDLTNQTAGSNDDAAETNAETTLTKDGDLGVNQPSQPATVPATPPSQPVAPASTLPEPTPPQSPDSMPAVASPDPIRGVGSPDPAPRVGSPDSTLRVDFTPPTTSQPSSTPGGQPEPLISAAEADKETDAQPVVISQADANGVKTVPKQELNDQVETLNGEVQALESKIQGINGDSTPGSAPVLPVAAAAPPANPGASLPPLGDLAANTDKKVETTLPGELAAKENAHQKPAAPATDDSAVATFSDIFAKSDKSKSDKKAGPVLAETPAKPIVPAVSAPNAPNTAADISAAATIGEVLAFFGIFVLALALLSPFYKTLISGSLYPMITAVAWLVAPVSLLVSFIVLLFAKGKGLLKVAILILLLIAAVFYFGVNTSGTISIQLNNLLGTLFASYR